MNRILNLTQHTSTDSQKEAGVFEPTLDEKNIVKQFLTMETLPSKSEIKKRAAGLAEEAYDILWNIEKNENFSDKSIDEAYALVDTALYGRKVLIAGAPYLMSYLEEELHNRMLIPVYSFSERVSEEVHNEDGSVTKRNVFMHKGFIEM